MPISQTTVTGAIKTPSNSGANIASVTFTLSDFDYEAGEIISTRAVSATVDPETGSFSVSLWPNDRGINGNTRYSVKFTLEDGAVIPGPSNLWLRYSDAPVTIEDVVFETKIYSFAAPYALRILSQDEFDALPAKAPNTLYIIKNPQPVGGGDDG